MLTDEKMGSRWVATSSDTKPVADSNGENGPANGSIIKEIDTGATYIYDADSNDWYEMGESAEGGSVG